MKKIFKLSHAMSWMVVLLFVVEFVASLVTQEHVIFCYWVYFIGLSTQLLNLIECFKLMRARAKWENVEHFIMQGIVITALFVGKIICYYGYEIVAFSFYFLSIVTFVAYLVADKIHEVSVK